jgi:hypothetical protein
LVEQVFAAASRQALFGFVKMLPQVVEIEHEFPSVSQGGGVFLAGQKGARPRLDLCLGAALGY